MKTSHESSINKYLVYRFVLIVFAVSFCESVIGLVLYRYFYPFLAQLLIYTNIKLVDSPMGLISGLFQTFGLLLLAFLDSLLPDFVSNGVSEVMKFLRLPLPYENLGTSLPSEMNSPLAENIYYLGLALVFLMILALLLLPYVLAGLFLSRLVSKKIGEPISKVSDAMEAVSKGSLETRLDFVTDDVFMNIRDSFNDMASQMEENARDKAEFEKRRNLMLSDIAHDLKTPITTISGYAAAISDGVVTDPETVLKYLNSIQTKSAHIDDLIRFLFEYVKLDSDGFRLNKERYNVTELLREAIALYYSEFEEKNMILEMDIPDERCDLTLDGMQISRVFANILSNFLRYNPAGSAMLISMNIKETVTIRFQDNGVAIDPELAKHIFEPFVTGDAARSTKGGNGLGLSIAQKIIQMHHGKLELENERAGSWMKGFVLTFDIEENNGDERMRDGHFD
ncbi:MAG: sensor histidine kinase [Lachnospiraceae bacterium]